MANEASYDKGDIGKGEKQLSDAEVHFAQ